MLGLPEGQGFNLGPTWIAEASSSTFQALWFLRYGLDHWAAPLWSHGVQLCVYCVNRTTQQVRILPCVIGAGEMSSEATAKLFFEAVVRFSGLPDEVLHDRDPHFTADFWRELWKLLGIRAVFSSAYHPKTDGRTERMHRTIE